MRAGRSVSITSEMVFLPSTGSRLPTGNSPIPPSECDHRDGTVALGTRHVELLDSEELSEFIADGGQEPLWRHAARHERCDPSQSGLLIRQPITLVRASLFEIAVATSSVNAVRCASASAGSGESRDQASINPH